MSCKWQQVFKRNGPASTREIFAGKRFTHWSLFGTSDKFQEQTSDKLWGGWAWLVATTNSFGVSNNPKANLVVKRKCLNIIYASSLSMSWRLAQTHTHASKFCHYLSCKAQVNMRQPCYGAKLTIGRRWSPRRISTPSPSSPKHRPQEHCLRRWNH